jgi:hypothetical protein
MMAHPVPVAFSVTLALPLRSTFRTRDVVTLAGTVAIAELLLESVTSPLVTPGVTTRSVC